MSEHSSGISVGHVYRSQYGVQYQVLAIWDTWCWLHVTYPAVSAARQPEGGPKTAPLGFLRIDGMRLQFDLSREAVSAAAKELR